MRSNCRRCLITLQRKSHTLGYFSSNRFSEALGQKLIDEIALNPDHLEGRSTREALSTLVHEMVHLWQAHFGDVSRGGYHNAEWAAKMEEIGLMPSETGEPGGKNVG